jgi:hypothetical protein
MARLISMKVGDLEPAVVLRCTSGGKPYDISEAASATFVMRARDADSPKVDTAATILDDGTGTNRGLVKYVWSTGDSDTAGDFLAWIQVDWGAGRVQTFPPIGALTVRFEADPDVVITP